MKYKPKLDPEKDLKGATPEALAYALLRSRNVSKLAGDRKILAKKLAPDHAGGGIPHQFDSI